MRVYQRGNALVRKGDRVSTPLGLGTVQYVRMSPPDFNTIGAICVRLDEREYARDTDGTIFGTHYNAVQPIGIVGA